jgi:DNA-binding transcriptional LysR family regulator
VGIDTASLPSFCVCLGASHEHVHRTPLRSQIDLSLWLLQYSRLSGTSKAAIENIDWTDISMSKTSARRGRQGGWALGLELRQLRAFVLLVDTGNLSAAARALGVAQSTMSEGIAALERAIGTRIVVRKRGERGIALTPAGEALLPHARRVLALLEDAHVAVAGVDRGIRTLVEVMANESVSTYLLPAALGEVRKEWPNLHFSVTVGMCPTIIEGLSAARYDVGLLLQSPTCRSADDARADDRPEDARAVVLAEVPLTLFAAAGHPLALCKDVALVSRGELAAYPIFLTDARGHFFDLVRECFRSDGVPNPRLESTGSVEAVKRAVLTEHLGLGVLPIYAIGEELRIGQFSVIRIQPDLPHMRLEAMSYRTRPPTHPAVAALLDAVRRSVSRSSEPALARAGKVAVR